MQEYLTIHGGMPLCGTVKVSGAKNSALPLLFATLLTAEECKLTNVPELDDIWVTLKLLASLGAESTFKDGVVKIKTPKIIDVKAPYPLVKAIRASFWALGPLLVRAGEARVALPGGDAIGSRPVDLHLKGLTQMGAEIEMRHGVVVANAPRGLTAQKIKLDFPSVGATHHLMITAALVNGETIIEGAACEPEVADVAVLLNGMGAQVEGAGTSRIVINGRDELGGAKAEVLGDRIEAATYLTAAAGTGGDVLATGISASDLQATLEILTKAGCEVTEEANGVRVKRIGELQAVSFETAPFPGLATDVQPLLMALMCGANGTSKISETMFENRLGHAAEYRRFGADIIIENQSAIINGVDCLGGAPVEARDIRAAAGLVIMGLMSEGPTIITGLKHLTRGYEDLTGKISKLGGRVDFTSFSQRTPVDLLDNLATS